MRTACEDDTVCSSRLVLDGTDLEFGPFEEGDFSGVLDPGAPDGGEVFGTADWSLLVNDLERYQGAVGSSAEGARRLLSAFDFIPKWRFDDVMVSNAPVSSGIGAHVDSYDVFLVQGSGKREWSIEARGMSVAEEYAKLEPDIDVRVLTGYEPTHTWVLEPGDML